MSDTSPTNPEVLVNCIDLIDVFPNIILIYLGNTS